MKTTDKIRKQLQENPVILYMKGTPEEPRCGFSAKAATVMKSTGFDFAYVDVMASPLIMEALPEVSDFPTFPQLFINGEIRLFDVPSGFSSDRYASVGAWTEAGERDGGRERDFAVGAWPPKPMAAG